MSTYNNTLRDLISFFKNEDGDNNSFSMILPTVLSMEMDGISGLVIGDIFSINKDLLPEAYSGLDYVVRKIRHRVSNNIWTTTIEAYPFKSNLGNNNVIDKRGQVQNLLAGKAKILEINTKGGGVIVNVKNIPSSDTINKVLEPVVNSQSTSQGMKTLVLAQAQQEGFFPGSKSYINNNPGNIRDINKNFIKFDSLDAGVRYKINYVHRVINGENKNYPKDPTLSQYINTYAPRSDNNNPDQYIAFIIQFFKQKGFNITPNMTLSQIISIG